MSLLVLATSGPLGEIALLSDGEHLLATVLGDGAARGRGLLPTAALLLEEAGLQPQQLRGIVVDRGPGSFTGVRVGVTTAKTLAFALDIPVFGVSSLAALAYGAPAARTVLAVRDAGRGRLYAARFGPLLEGGVRTPLGEPTRRPAAEVLARQGDDLIVDDDFEGLRAGAWAVLEAAQDLIRRGEATPPHALTPLYLQASAPERRRAGESDDHATGGTPTDRRSG